MKRNHTYRKGILCLGVIFLVITAALLVKYRTVSLADSVQPTVQFVANGTTTMGGEYSMTSSSLSVSVVISDLPSGWSLDIDQSNPDKRVKWGLTDAGIITVNTNANDSKISTINVQQLGSTYLQATVPFKVTNNGVSQSQNVTVSCKINVDFSIETGNAEFKADETVNADKPVLVTKVGSTPIQLSANYSSSSIPILWESGDSGVVTVGDYTGKVTPVGAGKTYIQATYNTGTKIYTSKVDVYVVPRVSADNAFAGASAESIRIKTNTDIYTDAAAGVSSDGTVTSAGIQNRITWEITKVINGQKTVISVGSQDSNIVKSSDLIKLDPVAGADNRYALTVDAKAGVYEIKFYPTGIYEAYAKAEKIEQIPQYFCTTKRINLCANFEVGRTKEVTIAPGDSYNLATAFNMTLEDFYKMLSVTYITSEGGVSYGNSSTVSYVPQTGIANGIIEGTVKLNVAIARTDGNGFNLGDICMPEDSALTSGGKPSPVLIHVVNGLALDRKNVTLAVGATLQLTESHPDTEKPFTFSWTSSDPARVTVDQNGLITALKTTDGVQDVIITLTQTFSDGTMKRATCSVKVVTTVTDIKLNYSTVNVEVDKTVTILATFTPNVSTAPIKWLSSNPSIVNMSVANDNKSVVITGKTPGTTVITAVNADNYVTASCTVKVVSPIKTIALDQTQLTVKLSKQEVKLKATYTPGDATSTDLKWSTSNASVAKVDNSGLVTLVSAGTAIITVQPVYNPYLTMAQCVITVQQSTNGLTMSQTELTLEKGSSQNLTCTLTPANAYADITWKSMDTSVATVSSTGRVTAVKTGKTYVIATTENGYSATCLVIVTEAASGITLDVYHLSLAVGKSYQVTAVPNPITSSEKTFTWTSKDTSIATVNASGKVTAVKSGETVILVKTKSGKVTYLYVNVYDKVTGMKLNYSKKTVIKGKKFTLKPIFTPANATNKKVTWKSSNSKVATVSSGGVVTGVRGGSAIITAVSQDGGYVATCIVKVKQPVTSITLNKSSYALGIGKSIKLKATVKSTYSSKQKLKWTSSNVRIATVSQSGVVTGKKRGTVTIKVRATDGSGVYATCKIRVVRQVTKITLNKSTIKMLVGKTTKISARITPSSATYKSVIWSSSDSKIAAVDSRGYITANAVGSCKIYAKAKDNSGKRAYVMVYVSKAVPSTGVNISASDRDMIMVRGTSSMVNYTVVPNNTTDKVRFSSDNKSVASVSSTGRVTARKPGVATITISTSSGKVGMVNVTVVGLNRTSVTAGQYERIELWVEQMPTGVKWYSENASIASVDSSGSVVTRKKGTTRIIANVSGVRLYCTIRVI